MSVMDAILASEAKAQESKTKAQEESKTILENAKVEGEVEAKRINEATLVMIEKMNHDAMEQIAKNKAEINAKCKDECAEISNLASKNQQQAITIIKRRVMNP